jgi:hypothetical protein
MRKMTEQINPSSFVPAMEEGAQCPYCGGAWNRDCFGHQVRSPIGPSSERIMALFDEAIEAIKRA